MAEKRFEYHHQNVSFDRLIHCIFDKETQKDYSEETLSDLKDFLNDIVEENQKLKETLNLIAEADSYTKENSVKEILRREIKAIDTVAGESADAWNDYCLLSNFFEEQYNELWDNYED